jgi:PleD family two-component response regulator
MTARGRVASAMLMSASVQAMVTKRILLVDQEPQITLLVRQTLEKTGKYSVRAEHPGELALEAARSFRPDLILVDLMAEGADGDFFLPGSFTRTRSSRIRRWFV